MYLKINGFLYVAQEHMHRIGVAIVHIFRILCNGLDGS